MRRVLEPFDLPFVQRGLLEVGVLAIGAGLVGTWIVLRGLAFYSHAVGTAAFPGLVLADGLGFSAHLGAAATAAVVAAGVGWLARRDRDRYDSSTALVLVAALAVGVILASDVFHSGADVENLLFGSLLVIGPSDVLWAAGAGVAVIAGTLLLGHRWTVAGFDPTSARALGVRSALPDAAAARPRRPGGDRGALGHRRAPGHRAARRPRRHHAAAVLAPAPLAARERRAGRASRAPSACGSRSRPTRRPAPPSPCSAPRCSCSWPAAARCSPPGGPRRPRRPRRRAVLALALLVAGCGASGSADDGRLSVVATTTQLGDLVRNVGGHAVDVTQILRPNTDPHEYEPRPSDVLDTAGAKVVFENGDGLDGWMAKVVDEAGGSPTVVDLGAHVPDRLPGEASGPEASRYDPHWWHDPRNVEAAVGAIRDALGRADAGAEGAVSRATPPPTWPGSVASMPASAPASPRCRRRSASWSPTTTPSATSPAATECRSSAPSSRRRPPRRSPAPATSRS